MVQGKGGIARPSMTLWGKHRAMVEYWRFYGNKTTESRECTEDERTETTTPEAIGGLFKVERDRDNKDIASL